MTVHVKLDSALILLELKVKEEYAKHVRAVEFHIHPAV
jgi:hypothetical protein